jgi:hypothetical protein
LPYEIVPVVDSRALALPLEFGQEIAGLCHHGLLSAQDQNAQDLLIDMSGNGDVDMDDSNAGFNIMYQLEGKR